MAETNIRNLRIGDVLKAHGYVDDDAIAEALEFQKTHRELRLGEILIKLGHITEDVLLGFLSDLLGLRIVDLKQFHVDIDAVSVLPKAIAERYRVLLVAKDEGGAYLAVNDPLNYQALEDVRTFVSDNIQLLLCVKEDIENGIGYYYSELSARGAASEIKTGETIRGFDFDVTAGDEETPVVKLVNSLLMKGYSVGATDIHIEPYENELLIRLRVDGMLTDYLTLDQSVYNALTARLKIISGLDIAEKRLPQDGNFRYKLDDVQFNIRTSVIPTVFGEKIVMRFLDMKARITNAQTFGMDHDDYNTMLGILQNPHGIVYVSGATGSGKTTTLYFFMEYLSKKNVSIVSVEDPVERKLRRVAQMQANPAAGLTFQTGLRAILRQDPDIIMVGETRDEETASISVRAAITGHLVLSTIHTNSAVATISRLIDMGVPPYMVASSLTGLIAQRLVRKVCPLCKREYTPDESEAAALGVRPNRLVKGMGCKDCNHTGYKGRQAVHEIIEVDERMRRMINNRTDIDDIQEYCVRERGMRLLDDKIRELALNGVTTVAELLRITKTTNAR